MIACFLFFPFSYHLSFIFSVRKLTCPRGLAVDPSTGLLYIAEQGAHRIAVMDPTSGEVVRTIGKGHGSGPGQLNRPCGIALDAHGNLLVADQYNKRVVVFNAADGEYVAHFPTPSNPDFVFDNSQGNVVVSGGGGYSGDDSFVCVW